MAHRRTPPPLSQRTEYLEPDNDSDRDSGVGEDAGEDADSSHEATFTEEENVNIQDGLEENGGERRDFTVFVAFQGNMEDEDFARKLDTILSGIPNMLDMGKFCSYHCYWGKTAQDFLLLNLTFINIILK